MKRKLKYVWQPMLSTRRLWQTKNFSHFSRIQLFSAIRYTTTRKSAKKHTKLVYIGTTYLKTSVEESYGYVIFFILLLFKYGSMTTIVGMKFEYKIMVCFLVENEMFKWKTKQRRKNHRKICP